MYTRRTRYQNLSAILLYSLIIIASQAVALSFSFPITQALVQPITKENIKSKNLSTKSSRSSSSYLVKKCSRDHISKASELLADASINVDGSSPSSFQRMVQKLKVKSNIEQQLQSRHQCISIAERKMTVVEVDIEGSLRNNFRKLRTAHLWNDDTFRHKLNEAIDHTSEKMHGWEDQNFAITPVAEKLQHAMFVMLSGEDENVVGFCELAMLSSPSCGEREHESLLRPTIMNLVVDKEHRRRGLAEKLVESSRRYARQYFYLQNDDKRTVNYPSMGLYVHASNEAAKQLYNKLGFDFVDEVLLGSLTNQRNEVMVLNDDLCYMECILTDGQCHDTIENYVYA